MASTGTFRFLQTLAFASVILLYSVLHAQPAGGKWTEGQKLPILTNARMVFADSMIGYYIGSDTGYVTKDGGVSWSVMTFPSDARPAPTFLYAPDHNTIISFQRYSSDSNGTVFPGIIKSTDIGSHWSLIDKNPIPGNTHELTMWDATNGFRIWEDDVTLQEACGVTHDGGKTFTDIRGDATLNKYITQLPKNSVSIKSDWSDSLHGVIAVASKSLSKAYPVLLTSDGGRTWSEHYMKYNGDSTISLSNAYLYPGSNSVWVMPSTIQSKALADYFFYYSSDFGATWVMTDTVKQEFFYALAPVSPAAAWVAVIGSVRSPSSTQNVIAYKDIAGKWTYVDTVQGPVYRIDTLKGGIIIPRKIPLTIRDLQFTDPSHGWVRATFEPGTDTTKRDPFTHFFRFAASIPSSVGTSSDISSLRCIPDPASSTISIKGFAENETLLGLKLTGILGKECAVPVNDLGHGMELDIRRQPNGYYLVTIMTSQRTKTIPVVIMHY